MKWFYNMKISARLLSGFILVAVLAAIIGAIGISNIKVIESRDTVLYEKMTKPISEVVTATDSFHRMRVIIRDAIITTNKQLGEQELAKIEVRKAELNKVNENIKDIWQSQESKDAYNDYETKLHNLYDLLPGLIQTIESGDGATAAIMLQDAQPVGKAFSDTQDALSNIAKLEVDNARIQAEENTKIANTAVTSMFIIILVCVLLAVALGVLISNSISKPIRKLAAAADKLALGNVSVEIKSTTKDEIGKLNQSFSNMIENIRGQALNAQRIAEGNLDFKITEKSKEDVLSISMKQVVGALKELVSDANMLVNAAVEGNLATRADATQHKGDYRKIVEGVNNTLDAIVEPLKLGMIQLDKIAKGQDVEILKNEYKGEYFAFIDNLNQVRVSLYELIGESVKLVRNAKEGNLSYRADFSRLKGGYLNIVQGINDSLDAVIKPVQEAASVLDEMSKGNLQVSVKGDYKGDHANIKNSLNETISTLSSYIGEISSVLTEMSAGNLVVEITKDYRGDFTEIKDSLNNIIESFNEVMNDINDAVAQVALGSRQVSDSAQALAQGTTEQASSVEELTSSMDEIATKTKENAVNANQANTFALEAKTDAVKGNTQMNDMLIAMEEINETSTNISKIIKVIDEIAFQTNILALNAAVEAARAGQQGRGFAVVAEEVRNLAARSATAAKETGALIEGSVKKVKEGTKIADETAIALGKIVKGVSKVATLVGTIADASNEQATGIAQVNKGIMQVSQVVQTNSATSEESAAASEELSSQAELLNDKIARFKLKKLHNNDDNKKTVNDVRMLENSSNNIKSSIKTKKIILAKEEFGKY